MRRVSVFFVSVALLGALAGSASAQQNPLAPSAEKMAFDVKVRKIDLLNQILPVLFTRKQIDALLPVIERARVRVKETRKKEDVLIKDFQKSVDEAIKNGTEKQSVPPRKILTDLTRLLEAIRITRQMVAAENAKSVQEVFDKVCNAGQRKVAAQSLALGMFEPAPDPEKVTEAQRELIFVREILLDPLAYDLLVDLQKNLKD